MSLNNIQLKTSLLADLYKNALVETSTTPVPEKKEIRYLGNNQKNIIVVVSHTGIPFLPDKELSFLTSILAACKLSIADIGIVNKTRIDQNDLQNVIDAEGTHVLLFGTEPLSIGLPINFPVFQLQKFAHKVYLYAPSLSELENDKTSKQKLWTTLKTLFQL